MSDVLLSQGLRELHLFAGAGGGILGGMLLGHTCVCAVEIKPYRRQVLLQRQRDGIFPKFPIWDDVTTFDGKPWAGRVDVVCGGFPCQDISAAGKGVGIRGERSGLWSEFARIIGEVQPGFVWVENSPMLALRGLGVVLGDLAALGYDARWGVVSAADAIWSLGTPCLDHLRERVWIYGELADSGSWRFPGGWAKPAHENTRQTHQEGNQGSKPKIRRRSVLRGPSRQGRHTIRVDLQAEARERRGRSGNASWWAVEPRLGRVAHGVANRVERLEAIGDGQVPSVVRLAWNILSNL